MYTTLYTTQQRTEKNKYTTQQHTFVSLLPIGWSNEVLPRKITSHFAVKEEGKKKKSSPSVKSA